jgi:hypothetical protein
MQPTLDQDIVDTNNRTTPERNGDPMTHATTRLEHTATRFEGAQTALEHAQHAIDAAERAQLAAERTVALLRVTTLVTVGAIALGVVVLGAMKLRR